MKAVVSELKSGNVPGEPTEETEETADLSEMDADELLGQMDMSEFFDPSELEELQKEVNSET